MADIWMQLARQKYLYHYTTPEGLIGIVKSSRLWASDASYLNDSQELLAGADLARNRLAALSEDVPNDHRRERLDWLLRQIRRVGTVYSMSVYVCSLSGNGDLLSQWRAYCRGGGFAIGFPEDELRDAITSQHFSLEAVEYDPDRQRRILEDVLDEFALRWAKQAALPPEQDDSRFAVGSKLIWEIIRVAPRLKVNAFVEENESRIVSLPERRYDADEIHFRARGSLVVPYTEVRLPEGMDFWRNVRIIVGPTPHPEASIASVGAMVRRYRGFSPVVAPTEIPYREW